MTDTEVVRERLHALRTYVEVLRDFGSVTREDLEHNYERRWAVLHGLQLAIECVQDVTAHLVATRGLGPARNHTDAVDLLAAGSIIDTDLGARLRGMPGFRNILVHEYTAVDLDRVLSFLSRLDDFDAFIRAVNRTL